MAILRIGTSGWVYGSWAGRFYPEGLKQREWLTYYAQRYPCVEVNSTFYRLPLAKTVRRWTEVVPGDFRFVFKIWQEVSHRRRLRDAGEALARFAALVEPARVQAGPLLLQLPPSLAVDADLLEDFLKVYGEVCGGWPLAVEFRHASWYCREVAELLDTYKASMVVHDMPGSACAQPNAGAPFAYVRYHGAGVKYGGSYTRERLAGDARRIAERVGEGRDVWVFFNNDMGGHALANAAVLKECAGIAMG